MVLSRGPAQPPNDYAPDGVTATRRKRQDCTGAYGLRLFGIGALDSSRQTPGDWEAWTVTRIVEAGSELDGEEMSVWHDRALVPLPGLGRITVHRSRREITFATNRPLSDEIVLHPGLVPAAAVVNLWMGRACMHASAITAGGEVWALLADRGGGKSTTAALLAQRAHALFTDDMLVVEGTRCFAGPSSVDLRADASGELGGASMGIVGRRERWRKALPGAIAEAALGGFIELAWTDGPATLDELDLADRIELVGRHSSVPIDGEQLLALASRPALRLARPRGLDQAGAGIELLARAIGAP
jgi:hypothetical protein